MIVRSHIPSGLAAQRHARPATMSAFILVALILISAFFSASEIALTASRRTRLQTLADDGDTRALRVLQLKDTPGNFFDCTRIDPSSSFGMNSLPINANEPSATAATTTPNATANHFPIEM